VGGTSRARFLEGDTAGSYQEETNAKMGRIGKIFPHGMLGSTVKKMTGPDIVERMVWK
jgi:hypothetical protein